MNINRYPGHMDKTRREIIESLKLVDIVGEVIDSRIPVSSRNPMLDEIIGNKPRLIIMNKEDLADPEENAKRMKKFKEDGLFPIKLNSQKPIDTKKIYQLAYSLLREKFEMQEAKSMDSKTIKMMIVGIPNSGKSTFINNVSKKKGAKVGDRPGITKQKQRMKTGTDLLLLDTPGVLRPKFDQETGLNLSYTNAIKNEILNIEDVAFKFLENLKEAYPENLEKRYGIKVGDDILGIFEAIARNRGAIIRGGEIDYERTAKLILNDFRSGRLGRITLERL